MARFRRFRKRRRRTAWVPGINFGEGVANATLTLANIGLGSTTNGFTVALTDQSDLQDLGGEGAVVTRVLSNFACWRTQNTATPVQRFLRWALFVTESIPAAGATIFPPDLYTVAGQGQENILLMAQVLAPPYDIHAPSGPTEFIYHDRQYNLEDAGARRVLQNDLQLYFTIQSSTVGGTAPTSVSVAGWLRVLLAASARR